MSRFLHLHYQSQQNSCDKRAQKDYDKYFHILNLLNTTLLFKWDIDPHHVTIAIIYQMCFVKLSSAIGNRESVSTPRHRNL